MQAAFGFIETRGLVAAIEASDAMVKTAKVHFVRRQDIGSALVTVIVKGPLAACQAAVDAGRAAALRVGDLVSAHVIPNPYGDTNHLVDALLSPGNRIPPKANKNGPPKTKPKAPSRSKPSAGRRPSPHDRIRTALFDQPQGLTLKQLAAVISKESTETRRILKELMDQGMVEKVGTRYFIVEDRG